MAQKPTRVLMTAYDFFPNRGGVATYAQETAIALAELGCEVLILARKGQSSWSPEDKTTPSARPHIQVKSIELPKSGYLASVKFSKHIKNWVQKFEPHFILSTLWLPGALASLRATKGMVNPPPVFTAIHAMEILEPKNGWRSFLRKRLQFVKRKTFSKISGFFCVSQFSKNLLLENFEIDNKKVHVVPNGVNLSFWESQISKIKPKTSKLSSRKILTVSRLVPHKGIDNIIRSLPMALESHPDLIYQVGGQGPDQIRLKKLASELGVQESVEFLGFISDELLPDLYQNADLFVLMSRQDGHNVEGFGLVFLEAACFQTPSLGGNSGGIPDAVIDGRTGWLVDPNDVSAITNTLVEILNQPAEILKRGEQAYQRAKDQRLWSHTAQNIMSQWNKYRESKC